MDINLDPLILSLKLATITAIVLLIIGLPIAYFTYSVKSPLKIVLNAILSLPLVLPPSVLGFYFLIFLMPDGFLGRVLNQLFGLRLVFSFSGMVLASIIYSLPFMVQPLLSAMEKLPESFFEVSRLLGKTRWQTFSRVMIPNIKPAILSGFILSFAHTLGEFGVILMIGGNIPGKTRVASLAVFDELEALNYDQAHFYSLALLAMAFVIICTVYWLNARILLKYGS